MDLDGNHMIDYDEFAAATMRPAENGMTEAEQVKGALGRSFLAVIS